MHSPEEMARAGCTSLRGLRYWEEQGLFGPVERSSGGTRRYTPAQLEKARIIAAAQFGGWKLDDIKGMVLGYDLEAYEALVKRLSDQARAAARLVENLPRPPELRQAQEYDL